MPTEGAPNASLKLADKPGPSPLPSVTRLVPAATTRPVRSRLAAKPSWQITEDRFVIDCKTLAATNIQWTVITLIRRIETAFNGDQKEQ